MMTFRTQAVLGAGSSFGIIVSIELSVHKAPYSNPVQYMYTWGQPTLENAITAFTNFQDFGIKQAPPELSIRLSFGLPSNMNLYGKSSPPLYILTLELSLGNVVIQKH